jgi:DNA-binding HxlR family transcriptional regulator
MSNQTDCNEKLLPIMDAMDLLSGRWKIIIMTSLYINGKMRFNELKRSIPRVTGRTLSKDLKYLAENEIVRRTIKDTYPITVEYELTEYGQTLDTVFVALTEWGRNHRKRIIG